MDQDALVIALAPDLPAGNQFMDFRMQLLAREQAGLDHLLELGLQHVEFPGVDHDLVHLRPAGRVELAPRQRNEGAAGLEPFLAAHDIARRRAADRNVCAADDLLDRILRYDRDAELMRPLLGKGPPRLRPPRRAADFREFVHGREAAQRIRPHGADADEAEHLGIRRADPFAGDGSSRGAAGRIAPVLVDNGERLAGMRIGQRDVAGTIEPADRIAHPIVVIVVDADAGRRHVLEEGRLDVPVVVEVFRHVELEAVRVRPHHAAARVHMVDVLAHLERLLDAQEPERVLVRDEQNPFVVSHPVPL